MYGKAQLHLLNLRKRNLEFKECFHVISSLACRSSFFIFKNSFLVSFFIRWSEERISFFNPHRSVNANRFLMHHVRSFCSRRRRRVQFSLRINGKSIDWSTEEKKEEKNGEKLQVKVQGASWALSQFLRSNFTALPPTLTLCALWLNKDLIEMSRVASAQAKRKIESK